MTYPPSLCVSDGLGPSEAWKYVEAAPFPWRTTDDWQAVPNTLASEMFVLKQEGCPIKECKVMQGSSAITELKDAQGNVIRKAKEATTCDK